MLYNVYHVDHGELYKYLNLNYLELLDIVYSYFWEMARDKFETEFEDEIFTFHDTDEEFELADLSKEQQEEILVRYMEQNLDSLFNEIFNMNRNNAWHIYKVENDYLTLVDENQFRSIIYKQLTFRND